MPQINSKAHFWQHREKQEKQLSLEAQFDLKVTWKAKNSLLMLLELDQDLLFCADERETTSVPTFYFVKRNLYCKNHTCWFQRHGGVHESIHKWWVESVLKAIHIKFWCIHSRQFTMPSYPYICINFMFHTFFLRYPLHFVMIFLFLPIEMPIDQPVY